MRAVGRVLVLLATVLGFSTLGGFTGYMIGEFSPGGVAAIAEPGSPVRDAEATHDAVIGAVVGAILGIFLASRARTEPKK